MIHQWDIRGKCDGLTADPYTGQVIATVNEDANSSLYRVDPWSGQVTHYSYSKPLPHHGGTDAISFYNGQMLISASAPGTTGAAAPNPAYPAVYSVILDPAKHVAFFRALFYDESSATAANGAHCGDLPTDFGFPIDVHAHEPETVYVVPITSDSHHFPPEGRLRVYRSRTGGDEWEPLTKGLPQEHCYVNVLRDAMAVDSLDSCGIYFGTTGGQVYASADSGDSWEPIVRDLPAVLSIEVQTLP